MRHFLVSSLCALFCSCASLDATRDIPPSALGAICRASINQLRERSGSVSLTIVAARETAPLFSELTLAALRGRAGKTGLVDISAEAELLGRLREAHMSHQIRVPEDSACRWLVEHHPDPHELFLQFSSAFDNPYEAGERGVLARLSLGGSMGASWYWVVLKEGVTGTVVESVVTLDIDDG